ncbi:MAG TPA: amino acid adenylation domain-containing protein, partial [Segetibacter sp.]
VLVQVEQLPLTANGKVDRKALPDPDMSEMLSGQYAAPQSEVEKVLAEIWQDILEVDQVGVHDDFFELGGHSLLAVRLISSIRKELKTEMRIGDIFDYPTVALLAEQLQAQTGEAVAPSIEAVQLRPEKIPLSFSQERLWFIDKLEGSVQYHVPAVLRLKGNLNQEALSQALQMIVSRHEVLRTVFLENEGEAYQYIRDKEGWELNIIEGSSYVGDTEGLQLYIERLINKPFDLSAGYMLRAHLIILQKEEYILAVTLHHIASDGWSKSVLVREVVELYSAYVEERKAQLAPLPVQYADYSIWQRNYLQGELLEKKLGYWKEKLRDTSPLELPADYRRPAVQSTRGLSAGFIIEKDLSDGLDKLSRQQGVTLFMTLLAVFKVLLHRYSGQEDICVGTPVAGRQSHELEGLIGFFVNTLALRTEVRGDVLFTGLLQQVRLTTMEAYGHQEIPFEKVVEAVVKERDTSRNPLFQVMLVLRNTPEVPELRLGQVRLSGEGYEHTTTMFDITLYITETDKGLQCSVEYSTDLYKAETIERMISHYKQLLNSVVSTPYKKIGELPMLSKAEEHQLLVEFNDTKVQYPGDKTIVDLFEEQVKRTPEEVALIFEGEQVSYRELNERANRLGHYLRSRGVSKEVLVPICIERGVEMIVGILGIMKAAGAYVPIDPEYPIERIRYMLQDTGASLVVSSAESKTKIAAAEGLEIIEIDNNFFKDQPITNPEDKAAPNNLAYVIYTSGSTGNPKGVMIEHKGLVNLLVSISQQVEFSHNSSFLSVTTFSFDICYLEFYMPLITGGRLVIIPREVAMDGFKLAKRIASNHPTHIQGTPSTWKLLLNSSWQNEEKIKILIGGEAVKEDLKEELTKIGDVFNLYGPTETTIWSASKKLKSGEKVVIGQPISNTTIYILNQQMELCPTKTVGQIWIGGDGLARGYLNRPDLTKEKFLVRSNKGFEKRLYQTGDVGRWLPDGGIEYLDRIDHQVKIRGYRIELGEIETAVQKSGLVQQSAVVVSKGENVDDKQLSAYYIPKLEVVKEKERELQLRQLEIWKNVYDTEYANSDPNVDEELDFEIWKDSFTGKAIEVAQMSEWLQDIVKVILCENAGNILEIGCGTGLVYYQLVDKIKKYVGTDFSHASIKKIQSRISKGERDYRNAQFQVAAAHEINLSIQDKFDTIILNSIIQYFPGEDYMNDVINKSINLLTNSGRIVIGDVRDNRLLESFKYLLTLNKLHHSDGIQELKWEVEQELLREEELCFSPDYFYNLKSTYPQICHIEIKWKEATYINELSAYRYTVIVYVGAQINTHKPDWKQWEDVSDKRVFYNQIKTREPLIAISNVPNPRLSSEKIIDNVIKNQLVATVGELVLHLEKEDSQPLEINEIIEAATMEGYQLRTFLNSDPFKVNILFELNPATHIIYQNEEWKVSNREKSYTNIPLFADVSFLLNKDIKVLLQQSLPVHMIPANFIAQQKLPLTNNGKIDRKFLSEREERSLNSKLNYYPPRTIVEKVLAEIWQDLLPVEKVGIEDNFFELGGHSLLAMRLISAIRKELE